MAKKKSAIDQICNVKRAKGWFNHLSSEDQETALEVRKRVNSEHLALAPVARNLIEALGLSISTQQVSVWLKEQSN